MTYHISTSLNIPEINFPSLFEALPGNSILLLNDSPNFTILGATPQYINDLTTKKEDIIGKGIFEVFRVNATGFNKIEDKLINSLNYVLQHKETHDIPVHQYDVANNNGGFTEKYWRLTNRPVFSADGEVAYIIHIAEDITHDFVSNEQKEKIKTISKAYELFMQAPIPIQVYKGPDLILEMANQPTLNSWGKTADIIGKPLKEALPEIQEQGFIELLHQVMETNTPVYLYDIPGTFNINGKEHLGYYNTVYQPYYEEDKTIPCGVLVFGFDVTDKVLAKKQRQESEEKYHTLFETIDQGFCVLEMIFDDNNKPIDYQFLETNPVFEKQTGIKDAVGKHVSKLVPNLEQHWFDLYGNVALTGEAIHFNEVSQAMAKWFDVYAFKIGDKNSRKVALLFSDITEHKKAEEAIRQHEANIRNLVMQSPVAMCILNGPSFIVEIANDRMHELWGKLPQEIIGKPVFEVLTEAGEKGLEQEMKKVYATGERFIANEMAVPLPRDGKLEMLYINFVYEPFRDKEGNISGIMAVGYDVTEQVVALKKLEESHKEFLFVTDFMPQMIWLTRPDGYHYYYNKQWYDYTGLTYGETEGEGWNHVFHPDDQARAWKLWQHCLKTGEHYQIEYRCRRFDGEYRWVLGRALPFKDESGNIIKWFGTCTDIHNQKMEAQLLEEKVEERTRELKQVNEQLKQFAYSASHDLQEPLRKIIFFLDRLLVNLGTTLSEDNKKIADRIQNTTNRMRRLIDDLLDYSNTTLGFITTEMVDLNEVVHDVLDDMEVTIMEKRSEINIDELPKLNGNHRQLRQMFQNLISNALKYHRKDQNPQISVSSKIVKGIDTEGLLPEERRNNLYHLIEVKDNGIGFDPEDAEKIFRLFQRLHGKAEYEGSGVGLAIVQKVVENHDGYAWAESEPGEGASFKILLPV